MPINESKYTPNFIFKNKHINTAFKTLVYHQKINYKRERIETPDNDFLDLDFSTKNSETCVIALHGLEGSATSKYIISAISYLNNQGIDAVAVNFRGCSGEPNKQPYSYHSGKTDDLSLVINYIIKNYTYKNIFLLGYSMGGNIMLKYLGETENINPIIKGGIAFSVPCDLKGSAEALSSKHNKIYLNRFLKTLKDKTFKIIHKYPTINLSKEKIINSKTFEDFDNAVTAPLFHFKNAEDYYSKNSSKPFIKNIKTPTLLVNALDDVFLSETCYPYKICKNNKQVTFETPKYGGHVGFNTSFITKNNTWGEQRILQFITSILQN
ncbi:alpha/beta fold hydrolase [Lutibacter sp.]|uniref:YheT family hydrolase n=1 Tax=Lutibacter sp. TaxID=1925666 RepID=UPI0025BAE6DD|nr:alpha/beta fold hydrolase [Lutibacter sp.]MCF6181322.1 alpha/beta fold hydrolase [Lutibacter sp.]